MGNTCRINYKKFSLNHPDVNLFHGSEWARSRAHRPGWYLVYRIVMALLMLAGVVAHILSTADTLGAKWLIYMTNQGISLLTLHYVLYAIIVSFATLCCHSKVIYGALPLTYK